MANVLVQTHVMAMDVDALNRVGVYDSANVDNGTALVCGVQSTNAGQKHVFSVTPASGVAKGLWMAYSPEVDTTVDGVKKVASAASSATKMGVEAAKTVSGLPPV